EGKIAHFVGLHMNDAGLIVRMDGRDEAGSVVDADIGRHGNLRPVNNEVEMLMDVERVSFGRERGKMNRLQTGKKIFDFRYPGRRSRLIPGSLFGSVSFCAAPPWEINACDMNKPTRAMVPTMIPADLVLDLALNFM